MKNHKTEIKCNVCNRFSALPVLNGLCFDASSEKKTAELTLMGWMLSFPRVMKLDFVFFFFCET
jgi:hypothetical protein